MHAQELRDDDFILVGNQWRALFEIHRSSKSVTSMIAAPIPEAAQQLIDSLREVTNALS